VYTEKVHGVKTTTVQSVALLRLESAEEGGSRGERDIFSWISMISLSVGSSFLSLKRVLILIDGGQISLPEFPRDWTGKAVAGDPPLC